MLVENTNLDRIWDLLLNRIIDFLLNSNRIWLLHGHRERFVNWNLDRYRHRPVHRHSHRYLYLHGVRLRDRNFYAHGIRCWDLLLYHYVIRLGNMNCVRLWDGYLHVNGEGYLLFYRYVYKIRSVHRYFHRVRYRLVDCVRNRDRYR